MHNIKAQHVIAKITALANCPSKSNGPLNCNLGWNSLTKNMAWSVIRSRLISNISKSNDNRGNFWRINSSKSNVLAGAPKRESVVSSQSIVKDQTAAGNPEWQSPWRFFNCGSVRALTAAIAGFGCITYLSCASNLDEIKEKMKALQDSVKYTVGDAVSAVAATPKLTAGLNHHPHTLKIKYHGLLHTTVMIVESLSDMWCIAEEIFQAATRPISEKLLPDLDPAKQHVLTLVLDLNETLLYMDYSHGRRWIAWGRPEADLFLERMAKFYEIVVYSDEASVYIEPLCEAVDEKHYIQYKISKRSTKLHGGKYYRDLSKLNRDPAKILYVSGHAFESCLQTENCVPIKPFKGEQNDRTLVDLTAFLEYVALNRPADVRTILACYERKDVAAEFIKRYNEHQRRIQEHRLGKMVFGDVKDRVKNYIYIRQHSCSSNHSKFGKVLEVKL